MRITESELLEALRDAQKVPGADPTGAMTSHEMADVLGISHRTIVEYLKLLKRSGRLAVLRVRREGIDGRVSPVTAYRIVPKPKGKKKAA